MIRKGFAFVALACLLLGCAPKKAPNKFADPVLQKIADYQDRRLTDSLYQFFHSSNALYRAEAALAFASIQDTTASPALGNLLLEDPDQLVRLNAAVALGQTGGIMAVNALIPAIADSNAFVTREVLEALGKSVTKGDLTVLKTYSARDSVRQEGLSWGFYRLSLRGIADSVIMTGAAEFLKGGYTQSTRLAAAQFFSRTPISKSSPLTEQLISAALNDLSPEVRMAVASGMRKGEPTRVVAVLKKMSANDPDYRVRINAVRAISGFSSVESEGAVFNALGDSSLAVRVAASEVILRMVQKRPLKRIGEDIPRCKDIRVKSNLYSALLASPYDKATFEIIDLFGKTDDYGKADLLTALSFVKGIGEDTAFQFISTQVIESRISVIKSTGALALVNMNGHADFFKKRSVKFVEVYRKAIADGDPAVVGILAGALADSTFGYRTIVKDFSFLNDARKKLNLPKDIESLQPLEDALAYFEGKKKPIPLKNPFNHPIDWKTVAAVPEGQRVSLITSKGEIILRLLTNEAPGSVANFVQLIGKNYYDGRFVHRVVPNFVMQTGCIRGDGFGSEDYSIRSEFSTRHYRTGSVGYASAGKDTEGTQWFITHSPTPHLDGRYTIFAEVEEGMDVADQIEVGDKIVRVSLITN